jgi:hypothetical protein
VTVPVAKNSLKRKSGSISWAGLLIVLMVSAAGCRNETDQPLLCDPDLITSDGDCDEQWYSTFWRSASRWTKKTANNYLSDFLGIDFKKELEESIASSKAFQRARDKIRSLPDSFPRISIGDVMRTLQDPHSLETLAEFLHDGGPAAYELYQKAVEEGGPYLDQLETLLDDFANSHGIKDRELVQSITGAIRRYRENS